MDIMFLLDGSSNIGASEFEEMKNFVQAFIESADISMYLFQLIQTKTICIILHYLHDKTKTLNFFSPF